ncbi:hypothetical protein RF11_09891 [Thelohanellus kitauei]|uniref:Serpin domain-containing protein n=1 Tax=Thelohanellus kitauei TaxID=669202 RepID=A0A0C2MQW2_THEKT|nr:hypothetical protein RF11_09891 [Thelohanellus kitauei]
MTERVNELTLKLANFLLEKDGEWISFSISGFIAYLTLSFISIGLKGPTKYQLLDLLNCNFSYMEKSNTRIIMEHECTNSLKMDDFSKIGMAKSAIFHSKPAFQIFKQIALEYYDLEMHMIDPTNYDLQQHTINEWGKTLMDVPFINIFTDQYKEEVSVLIMNEYYASFEWRKHFHPKQNSLDMFKDSKMNIHTVDFMKRVDDYKYYNDTVIGASIVFLLLNKAGTYAAVVVPHSDNNVQNLLERMNVKILIKYRTRAYIPGFIIQSPNDLTYVYLNLD